MVQFVRSSFWAGETFIDLADAQAKVEAWCAGRAGMRVHGTTQCRPLEHFRLEEQPRCCRHRPSTTTCRSTRRVGCIGIITSRSPRRSTRSRGTCSAPACRSAPIASSSACSTGRQLIKVHPRQQPGHRSTDPADLPSEQTTYALRDIAHLQRLAAGHGEAIGVYAAAVLDTPLPWTKMRQVYALLGLVKKWGPDKVERRLPAGARRRSDQRAVDRPDARTSHRNAEQPDRPPAPPATTRFARDPGEFTTPAAKARRSA